ncbi:MAG: predicted Zn-dependent peptidases [Candidatus Paraimprobicoccus trichonymphae]|uniref:Predicted Zn-dependent peptidases n=1 Tax=Candidatus Paraimprobicoccus trichonymphae TaxID=3033793 RepID=A0AA48I4T6_9FIRM|nr:MAG: predicted Zn-dependent peptidases [Candidatus Paraimprobicoccus trichonymphae]
MNPEEINNEKLKEKYFYLKHESGLNIYVYPKENYNSIYCIIGTKFGSINNEFKDINTGRIIQVPDGIAHFLEHKLFENKNHADALSLFAKLGASANAYTSFDKTAYLFSCIDNFEESLKTLLDFVQNPYFTEQTIQKEQGIIGQEIQMYTDSPEWKVLINLLSSMYFFHPVRIDIAGSIESISKITPENLYVCHNNFYNLNNMTLCISGNVNPSNVFEIVDKNLDSKVSEKNFNVQSVFPDEPYAVKQDYISEEFEINSPIFNLGFKEDLNDLTVDSKMLAHTEILLYSIFSKSSKLYKELLDQSLINTDSFSCEYFEGPKFASVIISGESNNPERVSRIVKKELEEIKKNGIDKTVFEIAKKAIYGKNLKIFNDISSISNMILDFSLSKRDYFKSIDQLVNANLDDVNSRLNFQLNESKACLSVVQPKLKLPFFNS